MLPKFEQFIKERLYLHNVSPATVSWYPHNFKWMPSESPIEDALKAMVVRMREKGLRATGCNSAIRAINAYLKWSGSSLKIPQMKEPQLVLPTYTAGQIQLLLGWKPKKATGRRMSALTAFLVDTGCRVDEALSVHWKDIDFDNLLILLHGKGRKDRLVPMSVELRKRLFVYQRKAMQRTAWFSERKQGRSRAGATSYVTSKCCACHSASIRLLGRSMRCGTLSLSTICGRAGVSFICRRCSALLDA